MSNKRGRHHKRGGRTTPKGTRPLHSVQSASSAGYRAPEPPDLVARALDADGPLPLLALVSAMLWSLRPDAPDRPDDIPPIGEVVDSWIDVEDRHSSALLAVTAQMASDPAMRSRAAAEIVRRRRALPGWLQRLGDARITRSVLICHALGDGDLHLLELRLPDGDALTVDAYVDHNLGTAVKDAFVVPDPLDAVLATMEDLIDDPHTTVSDLDPADARARLDEALGNLVSLGLFAADGDAWPQCRPLLEWALRLMPPGGAGHRRTRWPAKERDALVERFFASPWGRPQRDGRRRYLLGQLLDLLDDDFETDIARWSPTVVATLVQRIVDESDLFPEDLRAVPDLLRGFVGFCHGERDIPGDLTEDTLTVVDHLTPELERHAVVLRDGDDWDAPDSPEEYFLQSLAEEVGGEDALLALDDRPLPDEPFDWSGVDAEVHDQVETILAIVEDQCEQQFDLELRTAARRFVARAAKGDPAAFARVRKAETAAAALVWIVAVANDSFTQHGLLVRDFMAGLGLSGSSPSQRADVFLRGCSGRALLRRPRPRRAQVPHLDEAARADAAPRSLPRPHRWLSLRSVRSGR